MSNTPKVRFAGYTKEWEKHKLSEVFDYLQNNTLSRAELSLENGVARNVHYGDVLIKLPEYLDVSKSALPFIESEQIAEKFKDSFLQDGDVVMADTAEDATVGKCSEVAGIDDFPTISGLHTIPMRPKEKYAPGYLGYYMNSDAYHKQLIPLMQGIKVSSVSKSAIKKTDIVFPSEHVEQATVGKLFIKLENLITFYRKEYDKLTSMKSACLYKMFPKNDDLVPELRFSGFTAKWEQKKLGKLVEIVDVDHKMPATVAEGIPYLMTGDFIGVNELDFVNAKKISQEDYINLSRKAKPERGDILFARYASIGAVRYIDFSKDFLVSYSCVIIKPHLEIDSRYLYHYLTSVGAQKQILIETKTGSQANIGIESMKKGILVTMPDIEEQKKIAEFLTGIDKLTTLYQYNLSKLKKIKQALVHNMFV